VPADVIVCAACRLPRGLHKVWGTRDAEGYHLEYGYACMGYEIAGGLGVKMATPDREVVVLVGDGSYLMMAQELATAIQEGIKITVVLLDNHGFASIGGLSAAVGCGGFATEYRRRTASGALDGTHVSVDFAANARSLGAHAVVAADPASLGHALIRARGAGSCADAAGCRADPAGSRAGCAGSCAGGAASCADGAGSCADGAARLADGAASLADGAASFPERCCFLR